MTTAQRGPDQLDPQLISTLNSRISDLGQVVSNGYTQLNTGLQAVLGKLNEFVTHREFAEHKRYVNSKFEEIDADAEEREARVLARLDEYFAAQNKVAEDRKASNRWFVGIAVTVVLGINTIVTTWLGFAFK